MALYNPKLWVDGRNGATPLDAAGLNDWEARIQFGIEVAGQQGGGVPETIVAGTVTTDVTLDMSSHIDVIWVVTLAGNSVKIEILGWSAGKTVMLEIHQNATGGWTPQQLPTAKWDGGAIPTGTTTPNATDLRGFVRGATQTFGFDSGTGMA